MTTPAFGFSAGDFISAVTLLRTLSKALRDAGGAAEDYRNLKEELDVLHNVLAQFQASQSGPAGPFSSPTKQQIGLALKTSSEFLSFISKFDAKLGGQAPSAWYRGAGKKAQWAVVYAKKVEELRAKVGFHLQGLCLMLQADETAAKGGRTARMDSLLAAIATETRNISATNINSTAAIERWETIIEDLKQSQESLISRYFNGTVAALESQGSKLVHLENLLGDATNSFQGSTKSRDLFPAGAEAHSPQEFQLASHPEQDEILFLLLRLLHTITRELRELLVRVWRFIPPFMAFIEALLSTLRREPMLLVSDSINFEDVLGRQFTLRYDFYRDLLRFESFLRHQFRQQPGERHVTSKQFLIMDSRSNLPVSSKSDWAKSVIPGCKITMSIKMQSLRGNARVCPRPGCNGNPASMQGHTTMVCRKCHLQYFPMPRNANTNGMELPRRLMSKFDQPSKFESSHSATSAVAHPGRGATGTRNDEITVFKRVHVSLLSDILHPALRRLSQRDSVMKPDITAEVLFSKAVHFDSHLERVRHFLQTERPLAVSRDPTNRPNDKDTLDGDGEASAAIEPSLQT
ncbi:hypothetical protein B0H63DRAFT_559950 [Podospora didyma]|uniref:Ubiquitin-like domain-containing protein n=1 Tax=Podospora didyma TaxID=330526 RepID=A0AAE0NPK5_9PEZI|nr:hypothetical protein B0H63DRAFT_559950 [Podospora didyma]